MGLGHRRRQLRHLPKSHHGSLYRMPSKSSLCDERGVHRCVGYLQPRFPFPLHFTMAESQISLPSRQPRLGVPEIRPINQTGRKRKGKPSFDGEGKSGISFRGGFKLHAVLENIMEHQGLLRVVESCHVPPVLNADPMGSHFTGFLL